LSTAASDNHFVLIL